MARSWRWLGLANVALTCLIAVSWLIVPRPAHAACQTLPSDKGQVSGTISVPTATTYRVWARLYPATASNNGLELQIDTTYCGVVIGHNAAIPAGQLTWVDYGTTTSHVINVTLSAGTHTLTLAGTDPGVEVDKVLLLSDTTCTPTGTGANCSSATTPTPSPVPPPGGGTSGQPTPSTGPTPTTVPIAAGSSQPISVSGTIALKGASAPAGSQVTYKVDGQPVSGSSIDTTKLSDGMHTIQELITTPSGQTITKTQTIKVENGWPYQLQRYVDKHLATSIGTAAILILLLGGGLLYAFGPKTWLPALWRRRFAHGPGSAARAATSPAPAGILAPSIVQPQTIYPEAVTPAPPVPAPPDNPRP